MIDESVIVGYKGFCPGVTELREEYPPEWKQFIVKVITIQLIIRMMMQGIFIVPTSHNI